MRILPLALILAAVLPLSAQAITIKTIPPKTQAACKKLTGRIKRHTQH